MGGIVGCLNGRLAGRMSVWSVVGYDVCMVGGLGICLNCGWDGRMFEWWVG